jgi:hypothetical protein
LSQYKKYKKLFISSYLVFAIAHCCQFPKLSKCKKVNSQFDAATFWYQALWRKKYSLHFYEVFNDFVLVLKELLFGRDTPRISAQASKFLDRIGTLEQMENHNVIGIFKSKENPSFLIPCHISDIMFVTKFGRKYNFWLHFFHEKQKKQFIHFPWKVGDFVFKSMKKIVKFENYFQISNLKYAENIKGFDPNGIFVEHMLIVGSTNSFIHTVLGEEEDNQLGNPTHTTSDLETILSTNELYRNR